MGYFVLAGDGKEYGPIDIPGLRLWVQEGRIIPDTLLRDAGTGNVFRASEIKELWRSAPPPQPGIYCSICGILNDPRQRVCSHCGAGLRGAGQPDCMTGSKIADGIIGFLVGMFSVFIYGVGIIGALILCLVIRRKYPSFSQGIIYGLLADVLIFLGMIAVCLKSYK